MIDYVFMSLMLAIGLLIGVATLPWRSRSHDEDDVLSSGSASHVIALTLFWPFIVPYAVWVTFRHWWRMYVNAWQRRNEEQSRS